MWPSLLILALLLLSLMLPYSVSEQHDEGVAVVYGDSRSGHLVHERIVDAIDEMDPVAVFHTGDLVDDGSSSGDWARFDEITSGLVGTTAFYPALGNHEIPPRMFFENFDLPNNERWYAVEVDDTCFIVLDSTHDASEGSEQYRWLEAQLKGAAGRAAFVVAVLHHSPFSTGQHGEDEKGLRQSLVPLFEQYGVDIVFSGHDHDYERSLVNGVRYVVTGGGGAPLRDQAGTSPWSEVFVKDYHFCALTTDGSELTVRVFDVDSQLVDEFTVTARE